MQHVYIRMYVCIYLCMCAQYLLVRIEISSIVIGRDAKLWNCVISLIETRVNAKDTV
jgi:hypothetical protein